MNVKMEAGCNVVSIWNGFFGSFVLKEFDNKAQTKDLHIS